MVITFVLIVSGIHANENIDKLKVVESSSTCYVKVDKSITAFTIINKGSDGAACSGSDECSSGVCEGGSCCTNYGDTCSSSSHCCGHQNCNNGTCPQ